MDNTPNGRDDALDAFLDGPAPRAENPELRHSLLLRTTRVVRFRRRLRLLAAVGVVAASFLAGAGTVRLWSLVPRPVEQTAGPEITSQEKPPDAPIAQAPAIDSQMPADILEQLAELAGKDRRAAYFCLAGARYEQAGELPAALRCYKLALDAGSEADLMVSETDSYLLMVLKTARQREKQHGKNDA